MTESSTQTEEKILAGIAAVAREHLEFSGELAPEMHLTEELGLDSLRRLILAAEVENLFRVRLEEDVEGTLETVADLVRLVAAKLREKRGEHA